MPVAMAMMLQGTDFEKLNRVDYRRARMAGSNIAGRASRLRHSPSLASTDARRLPQTRPLFERHISPWPLTPRPSELPSRRARRLALQQCLQSVRAQLGLLPGFQTFVSSINGGQRKCGRKPWAYSRLSPASSQHRLRKPTSR
ncbi:hypothetical protein AAFG13_00650 [Bradyrhizobium sp. B124]|uniref:hypothetical protein n=1 Tax=Bradyrhizobium sp. B124 TaxID=3140245 RepID=UPI00318424EC